MTRTEMTFKVSAQDREWLRNKTLDSVIADAQGYRLVADTIIDKCNPPDDDASEESILINAVTILFEYVMSIECTCHGDRAIEYEDRCERCRVLGRFQDKPLDP